MRNRVIFVYLLWSGLAGAAQAASAPQDNYDVKPSCETIKRRTTAMTLGQSKDPAKSGPALLTSLGDKDAMTRELAARGLGNLKYAPARARLGEILDSDPSDLVRQAAAVALRQLGDPQAVPALAKALGDSSVIVRITALAGIAQYKDAKARTAVEAVCKDKLPDVRRTAVYVLGRLEDVQSIPVVVNMTQDKDAGVRAGAAQALGALHASDAKEALKKLLKDTDHSVQASAAHSLMMLGDSSGLPAVQTLVTDHDLAVRLLAIDTIGWSPDPSAEATLKMLKSQLPKDSQPAIDEAIARTQSLRKKP